MKVFARLGAWCFALILLMAAPLIASTVLRINFAYLSQRANQVIGGRIANITAERDSENGYIYSTVTMDVSHAVPQQLAGQQFSFRMIGGELDGKTLYIADFPRLQVGQKVVLFLTGETSTVFGPTVGLWQGVFFVKPDKLGRRETVIDHLGRPILAVRDKQLVAGTEPAGDVSAAALSTAGASSGLGLGEFFELVRTHRSLPELETPNSP